MLLLRGRGAQMPRDGRCMRTRAHLRPCVRAQTSLDVLEDLLNPTEAIVELVNLLLAKEIIKSRSTTASKVKIQERKLTIRWKSGRASAAPEASGPLL